MEYLIEGKYHLTSPGDCMLINSGVIHQTRNASRTDFLSALVLVIPDSFISELVPDIVKPRFSLEHNPSARGIIATYLHQIYTYMKNPKPFQSLLIRKELISIIYQFFSRCYVEEASLADDNHTIKMITQYVEEHYAEDLALEKMADMFHLHKNYFCRYLKKETGLSFHQYLCQVRVRAALALLSSKEGYSVLDCALESGFTSGKLLNDWCRKLYGCTPLQYKDFLNDALMETDWADGACSDK